MNLLAVYDNGGTTPRYLHSDQLSTRFETNTSGSDVRDVGHYSFGESWYDSASGSSAAKWKFTNYERDTETSLDYAIMRNDLPRYGRYLQPDLLAGDISFPQSLNRYNYVLNDPIGLTDPFGLKCIRDKDGNVIGDDGTKPPCVPGTSITVTPDSGMPGADTGSNGWCNGRVVDGVCEFRVTLIQADGGSWFRTLGLRSPDQSFNQCMQAHSGDYSLLIVADVATNAGGAITNSELASLTPAANDVTQAYNAATGSLSDLIGTGPGIISRARGSTITYGRRTSTITSLNLKGVRGGPKGGIPALGPNPSNAKLSKKAARNALKLAVDVGFFLAEAVGCLGPSIP